MSYEISGPADGDIWIVVYKGTTTVHDRMAAIDVCCGHADSGPCRGVLVDFRGANLQMSTYDEFTLATELSSRPCLVGKRIAILQSADSDENNLFLTAAQNRGVVARVFHNEAEAWRFLTRKSRGPAVAPTS